jgi:hypothetical protein
MVDFEDVTAEFAFEPINLKYLAEDLWDTLSLIRGKLFTGTYKDRNIIYDGMINVFSKPSVIWERSIRNSWTDRPSGNPVRAQSSHKAIFFHAKL